MSCCLLMTSSLTWTLRRCHAECCPTSPSTTRRYVFSSTVCCQALQRDQARKCLVACWRLSLPSNVQAAVGEAIAALNIESSNLTDCHQEVDERSSTCGSSASGTAQCSHPDHGEPVSSFFYSWCEVHNCSLFKQLQDHIQQFVQ